MYERRDRRRRPARPSVELTVTETEPGIQGDRVSGARKPATLETGLVVQVPLFVNPGDRSRSTPAPASTSPGRERLRRSSVERRREARGSGRSALLYEAEAKDVAPSEVLAALPVAARPVRGRARAAASASTTREHRRAHRRGVAADWTLERMPAIDRALLRMGCYELLHEPDVPTAVIINEAVELAKRFSTDDSAAS